MEQYFMFRLLIDVILQLTGSRKLVSSMSAELTKEGEKTGKDFGLHTGGSRGWQSGHDPIWSVNGTSPPQPSKIFSTQK